MQVEFPDHLYVPSRNVAEVQAFLQSKAEEYKRIAREAVESKPEKKQAKEIADAIAYEILRSQECANLNEDRGARVTFSPDEALYWLSKLYEIGRGPQKSQKNGAGNAAEAFDRRSMKYFLHPQDMTFFVLQVLPHLSLYSFTNTYEQCEKKGISYETGSAISSVYFDNEEYDCYRNRMMRQEGAHLIRIRWYSAPGDADTNYIAPNSDVFIEQKTHREFSFGQRSVKERFGLKVENVMPYLQGKLDKTPLVEKLKSKKATQQAIDEFVRLYDDVTAKYRRQRLVPKIRTKYQRTAFQNGTDASYRVSIDKELRILKERNAEGGWRDPCRTPQNEGVLLPFYVAEIKIEGAGTDIPEWVQNLLNSPFLLGAPKFSKYGHGVRALWLGNNDDMLPEPYWYDQLPGLDTRASVRTPKGDTRLMKVLSADERTLSNRYAQLVGKTSANTVPLFSRFDNTIKKKPQFRTPEEYAGEVLGEGHDDSDHSGASSVSNMSDGDMD